MCYNILGSGNMANILDYVKKYGDISFEQEEFNELDNLIFACLSYVDFDGLVSKNNEDKMTIGEIAEKFFNKYTQKELDNNIMGVITAIKIFKSIRNKKRYKDLKVYNYSYKYDNLKQFSAMFIDIDSELTYISFEGTDDLISGWREDACMLYEFPVPAQADAINYINSKIPVFSSRKFILGGHSKGANLALVAGMYANPLIRNKIIKVYSNDGPGLRKAQIESRKYKKIFPKLIQIIPNYSVVGLLLRQTPNYEIVASDKSGMYAHNAIYWQVEDNHFLKTNLSAFSKKLDRIITDWLDTYNDEERKKMCEDIFEVFDRAGIVSLLDIKASTLVNIRKILKETSKIDQETKDMIINLAKFAINYISTDAKEYIKSKLKKKDE